MKVLPCLILALCELPTGWAQASPGAERRPARFELSTEMLRFSEPSTELFLGWQRNVNSGIQVGMDALSGSLGLDQPDQQLARGGLLAVASGVSYVVNDAFSVTAHDQRHIETARANGATSAGLVVGDSNRAPLGIWLFFLKSFDFTREAGLYTYEMPAGMTDAQKAAVAGAGLDTTLLIAAETARKIDRGDGHIADLTPYLLNKLWGINYFMVTGSTSDAQNYMGFLQAQGASTVTQQNVIRLQAASCLLSGGFLSLARGVWLYIADGNPKVQPLELDIEPARVFWPEITTWLNGGSVSVQTTVDVAWDENLFFLAGVDVPVLTTSQAAAEVTIGATVRIQVILVAAELTTNFAGMPFLLGNAQVAMDPRFSVGLQGYYGAGATMREVREYPLGPGVTAFIRAAL
ncbi:MAG TPA: hypothetical protein VL354_04660 [Spirochaetia bacterium]|nr:hypothetical protein [Spirochaetia bacterium]